MGEGSNGTKYPYPIKTIVVLVQENRSFDHMLGWMKQLNPEINGVSSPDEYSNPVDVSNANTKQVNFGNGSVYVDPDPGHSLQDIYEQVFGEAWSQDSSQKKLLPRMEGFAQNANRIKPGMDETVMNGFKPELVPVYKELVTQFAVCDRWFASVPGSTQPNRMYVHSATSHGLTSNNTQKLIAGLPQKTIFDSLDEAGYTFGIYYQSTPSTLLYRNLRKLKYLTHFHQFDLTFKKHCKDGNLPNYVVIEQRFFDLLAWPGNDDHPSHDVSRGQSLVKEVYESLRSSPQWNETLFIITYDEHGGFFDHVSPPMEGVPSPDSIVGPEPYKFGFDRLGVRVPAIFVSPWIEPGTVLHGASGPEVSSEYEHSSIPATVKKIFNLKNFLTKRDAWAGTFEILLNANTPRTDCPGVEDNSLLPIGTCHVLGMLSSPRSVFRVKLGTCSTKFNMTHFPNHRYNNYSPQIHDTHEMTRTMTATLPEPVKLRQSPAQENRTLSEFQAEMVQLAACLNGDCKKESYPFKLVEKMTVKQGLEYVEDAFKVYCDECHKAKMRGAEEDSCVVVESADGRAPKSYVRKIFSCLTCNN